MLSCVIVFVFAHMLAVYLHLCFGNDNREMEYSNVIFFILLFGCLQINLFVVKDKCRFITEAVP